MKSTKDGQKIYAKDQLNNNMECIEIVESPTSVRLLSGLNNNMGCIEISFRDEDETEKVLVE